MRLTSSFLICFVLLLGLSGCNEETSSGIESFGGMNSNQRAFSDSPALSEAPGGSPYSKTIVDRSKLKGRRIAENHFFQIELSRDNFQKRVRDDYAACLSLGCEIISSNISNGRNGRFSARLLPEKLAAYFKAIESGVGEIKQHRIGVSDKTNDYIDTEANLKTQKALRDRLTQLLNSSQTATVQDILKIEREIARTQRNIDSATGRMRHLQKITETATVELNYFVPVFERGDHYEKIATSFSRAWRGFIQNLDQVIVFTGKSLPWIPVILLGLWLFLRVIRASFSKSVGFFKRKKKKES